MEKRQVVGGEAKAASLERQAALDEDAAACRLRKGPLAVRGPASLDAQDPASASHALGHLVTGVRARSGVASLQGLHATDAVPLARAASQVRARLRLPRLLGGHAKAASLVVAEGGLDAGRPSEVRLGASVGAVGTTSVDGRALSAPCASTVRAKRATVGPAVRVANPVAA